MFGSLKGKFGFGKKVGEVLAAPVQGKAVAISEVSDPTFGQEKVTLANNDYTAIAKTILEGVGGKANVVSAENCITRLRMEIKDPALVDEKKIKSAGIAGVVRPGKNNVQAVVGTQVQFVADEFQKLLK